MIRRGLRLEAVAGLGMALAIFAGARAASAASASTETTLQVTTQDAGGHTKAALHVAVAGKDGSAASGAVLIQEGGKVLASIALSEGEANSELSLPAGAHNLRAVYAGDATHSSSTSVAQSVSAQASSTPSFTLSLTPVSPSTFPMTLTAGNAGTATVTVTPVNNSALTSPMFVTLSCSGLPDQSSCSFSPATVEILSTTPTSCASGSASSACPPTSTLVLQTQASGTARNLAPRDTHPVSWAILLPGMLGLGGLAFGLRRRRQWLSRIATVLLAVAVAIGLAGCNPRYSYYHHAPDTNLPTPSGSYTITVTGQTSDGLSAFSYSTTLALVVQ